MGISQFESILSQKISILISLLLQIFSVPNTELVKALRRRMLHRFPQERTRASDIKSELRSCFTIIQLSIPFIVLNLTVVDAEDAKTQSRMTEVRSESLPTFAEATPTAVDAEYLRILSRVNVARYAFNVLFIILAVYLIYFRNQLRLASVRVRNNFSDPQQTHNIPPSVRSTKIARRVIFVRLVSRTPKGMGMGMQSKVSVV